MLNDIDERSQMCYFSHFSQGAQFFRKMSLSQDRRKVYMSQTKSIHMHKLRTSSYYYHFY